VVHVYSSRKGSMKPKASKVIAGDRTLSDDLLTLELLDTSEVEYIDRFLDVSGGNVRSVERSFIRARQNGQEVHRPPSFSKEDVIESEARSFLEGRKVVFVKSADGRGFNIALDPPPVDGAIPPLDEVVVPGFSASFFSPLNATAGEESWPIAVSEFRDLVLTPGGDLFRAHLGEESEAAQFESRQRTAYWSALAGKLEARIAARKPEDAPHQVRVAIEGELTVGTAIDYVEGRRGKGRELSEKGKVLGTAIWDGRSNRLESLGVVWTSEMTMRSDIVIPGEPSPLPACAEILFECQVSWQMRCEYEIDAESK